ncbi:hypothetical protein ABIA06_003282 [Bradyrhizobium yuanmingense]|uniref:hypothetical protein n=1 Tax=Bradyrhizobium yuanmingense TaxID=108015 RepID=UPI0035193BEC
MLIAPYSRFFLRHHLRFRTAYNNGVPLPLRTDDGRLDICDVLQTAIDRNNATLVLRNKDIVRLTKLDVRADQNVAVLLFRRSDPDAATPIFENERTRQLRASDKKPEEAVAVSAHLFVRLGGIPDAVHPSYDAILEEVPGLSRTFVQALLHSIVRQINYKYTDRRGEEKDTYTMVDLQGIASEKVGGALSGNSVVPAVTLVRPGNVKGLDSEGLIVAREERMKLMIRAKPEQTLGVLKKIQRWMKTNNWPKLVVEVDMPEKRTRHVQLAREADAADILFVRSVQVDVPTQLEACTDVVNEELLQKALELFASEEP